MHNDYNLVKAVTQEEFNKTKPKDYSQYNKSDDEDIERTERLLDVRPGTLTAAGPYYLEKRECTSCAKIFTVYDFVLTALVDANHTKSFVLHTLIGNKLVVQSPGPLRCSQCGKVS